MLFIAIAGETLIGAGFYNECASNSAMGEAFEGICLKMLADIGLQANAMFKMRRT